MGDLTRTAEHLRELAADATPGTWRLSETIVGSRYKALVSDQRHPDRMVGGGWDFDETYGGCLVGESLMEGDRRYFAAMNPDVGTLLARMLEAVDAEDPVEVGRVARAICEEVRRCPT